jgi:hypothetical protein
MLGLLIHKEICAFYKVYLITSFSNIYYDIVVWDGMEGFRVKNVSFLPQNWQTNLLFGRDNQVDYSLMSRRARP